MSDSIEKSIWIGAPIEEVFEYFVDAQKMVEWCGVKAELDPRPGGIYKLDMGQAGVFQGRFLEVEKPNKVVYEVDPPPGMEMAPSRVEIKLLSDLEGTQVTVTHTGLPGPFMIPAQRGWSYHVGRLAIVATGTQVGADLLCSQSLEGSFGA